MGGGIGIWIRSWFGGGRTSRIGRIWWCRRRRCFIQEKVQPKVLIDDLARRSKVDQAAAEPQVDLFADFNGLPDDNARTEFYQHDANWTNRMILGDSLQVMASLAEREGLRGKVQCIYIDPPYGIKFGSNWQVSPPRKPRRERRQGRGRMTRQPEQVQCVSAITWRAGYPLLSGLSARPAGRSPAICTHREWVSVFVQIGDENVHRVRAVMDEVFGEDEFLLSDNPVTKKSLDTIGFKHRSTNVVRFYVLWYARDGESQCKVPTLFKSPRTDGRAGPEFAI